MFPANPSVDYLPGVGIFLARTVMRGAIHSNAVVGAVLEPFPVAVSLVSTPLEASPVEGEVSTVVAAVDNRTR